jgi:hypothetical protein
MCAGEDLRDKVEQDPKQCLELYADCKYDFNTWYYSLPWNKKEGPVEENVDSGEEKKGA